MMLSVEDEGDRGTEAGAAVGLAGGNAVGAGHGGLFLAAGYFTEQFVDVGVGIALGPGIAGGFHARGAAQDVDLQAGIVGKAVESRLLKDVVGLLHGVGP